MGYIFGHLLLILLCFFPCQLAFSSLAQPQSCSKGQSLALVEFMQTLVVEASSSSYWCGQKSYAKTSTWNMSRDCCLWDGVICDEMTGHVIELDLSCSNLVGKIDSNSSLFNLSHLQKLNLSRNFLPSLISPKFGRFLSLTHLDLSYSSFLGQIPSEISHLSKLQSLHLAQPLRMLSFGPYDFKLLLQNLTLLRELDLTEVDISSAIPQNLSSYITTLRLGSTELNGIIPETIFHLPNLQVLTLSNNNQLGGYFPKTKWNSSASLRELDLSPVKFYGDLPESLGYLTSLQSLELNSCNLSGPIPKSLWNLTRLELLHLSKNHLEGPIPLSLGYLTSLRSLQLNSCNLSGPIPKSLWNLTRIEFMDFRNNHLEGPIPPFTSGLQNLNTLLLTNNSLNGALPSWISSLPSLSELDLSRNHFSGQLEDFKYNTLVRINLGHNQLQGPLPKSLQNLVNLTILYLSFNNFSGNVDVSIFSNLKQLTDLDLSYNSISLTNKNKTKSTLPESLTSLLLSACEVNELDFLRSAKNLEQLDLSHNKIQGTIPDWAWSNWMHSMSVLDLSHNMLTSFDHIHLLPLYAIDLRSNFLQGSLPVPQPSVQFFFMSNNNLTGEIPSSFCNFTSLIILDLSRNKLKGAIPQCLGNMSKLLVVFDMQNNSLSGNLQITCTSGSSLKSFNLHGNKLEGKIPGSLANCKQLEVLDLGNNHLNDTFPMWLGTLPTLQVLSLRSNKLHGHIRTSSIENLFPQLRILDLSGNAFTAELPTSLFQQLKAMRRMDQTIKPPISDEGDLYYTDSVTVVTKGLEREVVRILSLYTTIDLSNNKFEGHIPSVLGDLHSLRVLNLSHNGLQGHIPPSLGNLSLVESLDLSSNQLAGKIPEQLASKLTSLAVLNLSYNHLEGCIPRGPQFATFENNTYKGNDELRGFPLSRGCGSNGMPETNNTTREFDKESNSTFLSEFRKAMLMGYGSGLIIGFFIAYFMLSTRNPNWLSWIVEKLEYIIIARRRKKQQGQRCYGGRNNGV
ncbi:receptor-like protein Cf-9 [Nicotiana tabacum]|uniref:receptor-like protein Cf-9 n=1 Tax=Nicotiana tabacum TaxID=4097 RepID=UPI003F4F2DE2